MRESLLLVTISAIVSLSQGNILGHILPGNQPQLSMYDVVLQKCPNIANTSLINQTEFKTCVDWAKINATDKFSDETIPNIRCLLYYDTLVSFCMNAGELLVASPSIVDENNMKLPKTVNLASICNDSIGLLKGTKHNLSQIVTDNDCFGLCLEYKKHFSVNSFCAKAYYFATFKVDAFKKTVVNLVNSQANLEKVKEKNVASHHEINPDKSPNQPQEPPSVEKLGGENVAPAELKPAESLAEEDPAKVKTANEKQIDKDLNEPVINDENVKTQGNKVNDVEREQEIGNNAESQDAKGLQPVQNVVNSNMQVPAEEVIPDVKKPSTPLNIKPKSETAEKVLEPIHEKPIDSNINNPVKDEENDGNEGQDVINNNDADVDSGNNVDVDDTYDENIKLNLNNGNKGKGEEVNKPISKPEALEDDRLTATQEEITDGDSYFFSYFMVMMCLCIVSYVGYHNRHKVFGLLVEGRQRGKRPISRGGRRPNSANYHKLDSNLEEALSSSVKKSSTNIIY